MRGPSSTPSPPALLVARRRRRGRGDRPCSVSGHVRRLVPSTRDGFDAEVSSQVLGVVASLFGLLLAFVVVIEFQAFSAAEDNVRLEADDLGCDRSRQQRLRRAGRLERSGRRSVDYVHAVVEEEWPLMRDGKESTVAWADIDGIFDAMQTLPARGRRPSVLLRRLRATSECPCSTPGATASGRAAATTCRS